MKQKTATGAKDPRHLSSIAPTVAHVTDGTKVGSNRPFRASIPEGYTMKPGWLAAPALAFMAFGAKQRRPDKPMTPAQWGGLLRRIRFAPIHIPEVQARLCEGYPQPLSLDEWADLFEQLAMEHVLATKYAHLR